MPEGDTIHTVARALGPMLVGVEVVGLEVAGAEVALEVGATVASVQARGKHLVIALASGGAAPVLRVHLGRGGAWHRYRPGEGWPKPAWRARAVIRTAAWVVVCFDAAAAELYPDAAAAERGILGELGPDLLGGEVDLAQVVARARARAGLAPAMAIADLLLEQRVAAGIGNVYKSEVLFLEGVDPWAAVSELADAAIAALYARARGLLRENVELGGWRTTTRAELGGFGVAGSEASRRRAAAARGEDGAAAESPAAARGYALPSEARYWVYQRQGRPCRRCRTVIRVRNQGPMGRRTFWCPACQAG